MFNNFYRNSAAINMRYLHVFVLGLLLILGSTASVAGKHGVERYRGGTSSPGKVFGMERIDSSFNVDETTSRLEDGIIGRGLGVFAVVDHAANAAAVGKELRPTKLVIFGNPNIGSDLMASDQTIGIDLPQKFLIWEGEEGEIYIGYNRAEYLRMRHTIVDRDEIFRTVAGALDAIANAAAGNE